MSKKKIDLSLITGWIVFVLCIGFDYMFDNCQISTVKAICKIFIAIGTASTTFTIKTIVEGR